MKYNTLNLKEELEHKLQYSVNHSPISFGLDAIRQVYNDKVWLVGDYISASAASIFDPEKRPCKDIGLLMKYEVPFDNIDTPAGWNRSISEAGALRLRKYGNIIDIFSLADVKRFTDRNMNMTIDNYLNTQPLTSQVIAYDINENKLYGYLGMCAIRRKTVSSHDIHTLETHAKREGISVDGYIIKRGEALGFTALIPSDDTCTFSLTF